MRKTLLAEVRAGQFQNVLDQFGFGAVVAKRVHMASQWKACREGEELQFGY